MLPRTGTEVDEGGGIRRVLLDGVFLRRFRDAGVEVDEASTSEDY
jgi:hypothetical protein